MQFLPPSPPARACIHSLPGLEALVTLALGAGAALAPPDLPSSDWIRPERACGVKAGGTSLLSGGDSGGGHRRGLSWLDTTVTAAMA